MKEQTFSKVILNRIVQVQNTRQRKYIKDELRYLQEYNMSQGWSKIQNSCCKKINSYYIKEAQDKQKLTLWDDIILEVNGRLGSILDIYRIWYRLEYETLEKMNGGSLYKKPFDPFWHIVFSNSSIRLDLNYRKEDGCKELYVGSSKKNPWQTIVNSCNKRLVKVYQDRKELRGTSWGVCIHLNLVKMKKNSLLKMRVKNIVDGINARIHDQSYAPTINELKS